MGGNYPVDWEETVLAYLESKTVVECAKRLGVAVNTASTRITRLRSEGVKLPYKTDRSHLGGQHPRPIPVDALNKLIAEHQST